MTKERLFELAVQMAAPKIIEHWVGQGLTQEQRTVGAAATIAQCYDYILAGWRQVEGKANP